MTVARPLAAFVSGVTVGFIENSISPPDDQDKAGFFAESVNIIPVTSSGQTSASFGSKFLDGMRYAFVSVWGEIVFWFFAGLFLAGMITVYLPDTLSEMILGGGLVSMLAMLLVGMPIYICATASTPIAAALLLKGASPGAVLVFLLVGPATNMTSLSVLIQLLGKMGTVRYLAGIAVVSIIFGLGVDVLYDYLAVEPRAVISEVREILPYWLKLSAAVVVLLLSLGHVYVWLRNKRRNQGEAIILSGFPPLQNGLRQDPVKHQVKINPVSKLQEEQKNR